MNIQKLGLPIDRIPFPSRLILADTERVFFLQAKGINMEPEVKNGDHLLCEMTEHFKINSLVILWDGQKTFHLKYYRELDGTPFYEDAYLDFFHTQALSP